MPLVSPRRPRLKPALLACVAGVCLFASPALAQQVDSTKLLELMVAKGLVTRGEADALIAQATVAPASAPPAAIPAGGVSGDIQTIPYVPQVVRDQIKSELRAELGQQAQAEGWAKPGQTPDWTRRITVSGDIRARGEGAFMGENNGDIFEDFGAINAGSGQNINDLTPGFVSPPFLNTLQDRRRARIRARIGIKAQIDSWISADVRIATGNDSSPVSTNQTMGANGSLSKYALWLDRASIRLTPVKGLNIDAGRLANPFWTSDLLFDDDLNFDGLAVSGAAPLTSRVNLFGAAGLFPVFNTDFNFGSRNAPEGAGGPYKSKDKYLGAVQAGVDYAISDNIHLRAAGGYFRFEGVEGETSSPCYYYEVVCDTDPTRPQFQQLGNTMFPIRNIIANPLDPVGSPENQYFGLATKYQVLDVRAAIDLTMFDPVAIRLEGDFVKNLGFERDLLRARAVNNLGPQKSIPDPADPTKTLIVDGGYAGGDTGWSTKLTVGKFDLVQPGDWNLSVGYRHLESDAVLDAFTDSDFGFGGTNNKGWTIGGNYAFGKNTSIGVRWLSADEIVDAPLSVDRLLIDLNTRF